MGTYAKVIADSISPDGVRLTTFESCFHRFVLSEFNTHRVFSRNSASSRAIPLAKQVSRVREAPALPVVWPAEQKGMQGGDEVSEEWETIAREAWVDASHHAAHAAKLIGAAGVHKSIANRLLEPFMMHTAVITSTAWENFFTQRCSPLAQPEIRVVAEMMKAAYDESEPAELGDDDWHLPYIEKSSDEETAEIRAHGVQSDNWVTACKVSAARCARVSYLTQDGKRDLQADLDLYERLTTAQPPHWSPLEHVATPWGWNRQEGCIHFGQDPDAEHDTFTCTPLDHLPRTGNLLGWRSLRTTVEAEQGLVTFR